MFNPIPTGRLFPRDNSCSVAGHGYKLFNPIPKGRLLSIANNDLPFGIGLNTMPFNESMLHAPGFAGAGRICFNLP